MKLICLIQHWFLNAILRNLYERFREGGLGRSGIDLRIRIIGGTVPILSPA